MLGGIDLDVLTDHYAAIVWSTDTVPAIVGHSVGGLIAQRLITANAGRAAVAVSAAPTNDVPLPAPPARLLPTAPSRPRHPTTSHASPSCD
ncbi:alpha/beta fold hydrolase [Streptomyces inhibens]|uniref:alpha/beta fold hydrolase n=1 Tax=Streptomyces inhibens TaxID=2293571 RepID=UPI0037B4AD7B